MIEIFIWVFFAVVIGYAAFRRGRSCFGWFLLGILISPLLAGFLLLALPNKTMRAPTPETHVKCPDCAELVRREARVCMHCGCRLIPQ